MAGMNKRKRGRAVEQLSEDRVSVKLHASPVLHSINYLLGSLEEKYLTPLREFQGLQSYPSRSKTPTPSITQPAQLGLEPRLRFGERSRGDIPRL